MKMKIKMPQAPEIDFGRQWRAVIAEFLATGMLVFFGCMSCVPMVDDPGFSILFPALGFGMVVMFNIQIFGHISGALMNPFIPIAAVIWEKMPVPLAVAYIFAECAGAIFGYGLLVLLAPIDVAADGICVTAPHGVTDLQALGIEIMLTVALSLMNCSAFDPVNAHNTDSLPMKFGFCITVLAMIGANKTGAGINPARSLGPAVWTNRWDSHWIYWAGPMVGGIIPAIFYKLIWIRPAKEELKTLS